MRHTFISIALATYLFSNQVSIEEIDKSNLKLSLSGYKETLLSLSREFVDLEKKELKNRKKIETLIEKMVLQNRKIAKLTLMLRKQSNILSNLEKNLDEKAQESYSQNVSKQKNIKSEIFTTEERVKKFKPSTFKLDEDSSLFDKPNGITITKWQEGKRFTAYEESNNFIKISGEIDKSGWKKVNKPLWIKKETISKK